MPSKTYLSFSYTPVLVKSNITKISTEDPRFHCNFLKVGNFYKKNKDCVPSM